jgi:hypothetical protein
MIEISLRGRSVVCLYPWFSNFATCAIFCTDGRVGVGFKIDDGK